jgi:hypothetical protein
MHVWFGNGDGALTSYVDSNFGGDLDKMTLIGYIFNIRDCAIS